MRQRGVGDALHGAHHLRHRLRFGTRGLLPQALGSLALGTLTLGYVLELGYQLALLALASGGCDAQRHLQNVAVGMHEAALGADDPAHALLQLRARTPVRRPLLGMDDRLPAV